MRIALCFSGQIRTGAVTAPNILRYIGDLRDSCDIFVHTWDTECLGTGYSNRLQINALDDSVHEAKAVSQREKFADFYRAFSPRVMITEEYDLVPTKSTWGGRRYCPGTGKRYVSMWDSVHQANKIKQDYASRNGIEYDITVRIRPDIVFDASKSLADDIALIKHNNMFVFGDHYNVWPGHGMHRLEDIFWIGPSRVMDQICCMHEFMANTTTDEQIDDPKHPEYKDWQFHGAQWIRNQLGIEFQPLENNIMRIYYQVDVDQQIDPLNPGFGPAPKYGGFQNPYS